MTATGYTSGERAGRHGARQPATDDAFWNIVAGDYRDIDAILAVLHEGPLDLKTISKIINRDIHHVSSLVKRLVAGGLVTSYRLFPKRGSTAGIRTLHAIVV